MIERRTIDTKKSDARGFFLPGRATGAAYASDAPTTCSEHRCHCSVAPTSPAPSRATVGAGAGAFYLEVAT